MYVRLGVPNATFVVHANLYQPRRAQWFAGCQRQSQIRVSQDLRFASLSAGIALGNNIEVGSDIGFQTLAQLG